jgi:hypothetical protein
MLKKEFKRKDVERARNLIMGKANESSEIQIGYTKKTQEYKEGDIWIENNKTWTIKNGIKKTISKLSNIRKEIFIPLSCPECKKVMKKRLDKPNYRVHKKCHDCVILFEHKLKIKNIHGGYIKDLEKKNSIDIVKETEALLLDMVNNQNKKFVSEDGVVETWKGGINEKEYTKKIKNASKKRIKNIQNN